MKFATLFNCFFLMSSLAFSQTEGQLKQLLQRYPKADKDRNGKLTPNEAKSFMASQRQGVPMKFRVNPGWSKNRFPDNAVCYMPPAKIQNLYKRVFPKDFKPIFKVPKPNIALRIVGTGHSFMAPGYKTFPIICRAAGFEQPLRTHTGGGITGSARYKWEEENGIFDFTNKPKPKLLSAISTGSWDAMMWGPYYEDRAEYYSCWIDFCLKHNPEMEFYLSDAWPSLRQLNPPPKSEDDLNLNVFVKLDKEKDKNLKDLVEELEQKYPNKVHIIPTSDAMVLAVQAYYQGKLPEVKSINRWLSGETYSIWRDKLGHLGPGFERLEGYVFYATVYKRSPVHIEGEIPFKSIIDKKLGKLNDPSKEMDLLFRHIAWKAVINNPMSGVLDKNKDGIGD